MRRLAAVSLALLGVGGAAAAEAGRPDPGGRADLDRR